VVLYDAKLGLGRDGLIEVGDGQAVEHNTQHPQAIQEPL